MFVRKTVFSKSLCIYIKQLNKKDCAGEKNKNMWAYDNMSSNKNCNETKLR